MKRIFSLMLIVIMVLGILYVPNINLIAPHTSSPSVPKTITQLPPSPSFNTFSVGISVGLSLETEVDQDPANSNKLVVSFNAAQGFNGTDNIISRYSTNGGLTWTNGYIKTSISPAGASQFDGNIHFLSSGTAYMGNFAANSAPFGMALIKTTNDGARWSSSTSYAFTNTTLFTDGTGNGDTAFPCSAHGGINGDDYPKLATDKVNGIIYYLSDVIMGKVSGSGVSCASNGRFEMAIMHSTDGGATWINPIMFTPNTVSYPTGGMPLMVVDASGNLDIIAKAGTLINNVCTNPSTIAGSMIMLQSTDHGQTFTTSCVYDLLSGPAPDRPGLVGSAGHLVAYFRLAGNHLFAVISYIAGSWGAPVQIDSSSAVSPLQPTSAISSDGRLFATFWSDLRNSGGNLTISDYFFNYIDLSVGISTEVRITTNGPYYGISTVGNDFFSTEFLGSTYSLIGTFSAGIVKCNAPPNGCSNANGGTNLYQWVALTTISLSTPPPVNSIQVGPIVAFPMDTVLADTHTAVGSFGITTNIVRMIDTTTFHNDAKPCVGLTSYVVGANAGAQLFNNTNDQDQCWQVASNINLHADSFGNYLTLAAWIRLDSANALSCVVSKFLEYSLCIGANNKLEAILWDSGGGEHDFFGNTVLTTNTFYHIATTWNSTTVKLYLNGHNDTTSGYIFNSVSGAAVHNSQSLTIGGIDGESFPYNGIIDEVYLYKRPLGQQEIGTIMFQAMQTRPISSYLPDTTISASGGSNPSCSAPCQGFNQGNTELPFAKSSAGADAETNSTTYLPGPITVHQILNISVTGANTGGSASCPTQLITLGNGASIASTKICDRFVWTWDFFRQNIFQSEYGIRLNILNNGGGPCNVGSACSLWIDTFSIVNGVETDTGFNNNNATTVDKTSYWVGIDMAIMQDNQHVNLRVTNYDQSQAGLWCTNTALLVGVCRQFNEGILPLEDSAGNIRSVDYFDIYAQQNVEVWAQHAAGATTASIIDHRAGYTIDGTCIQFTRGGSRVSGSEIDAIAEIINWIFQSCGSSSGTSGGYNPSASTPCLFNCSGDGGSSCGSLNFACDIASSLTQSLLSGLSVIFAPVETSINSLAGGVANAIVSLLVGAWQIFAGGMDNLISVLTGGKVVNGFTTFWANITNIITTLETNSGSIINGTVTVFATTVSIIGTLTVFIAGTGTNIGTTLATVLSTVLGNGALVQLISGTGNLLLALFGKGSGPNGTQFTANGITYDWGPGGQVLANSGFQTLIVLLIGLWLIMNMLRHPIEFGGQIGHLIFTWGHIFTTILLWFFDVFMKVVSWFKSLIPTWGSSW